MAHRLRALAAAVALIAALAAIAGCGSSEEGGSTGSTSASATGTGDPNATLTIGVTSAPGSLDPARDGYGTQAILRHLTHEPLVTITEDGTFRPALAERFGYVGRGNRTFEFTLRRDAKFADGSPVTAEAVKAWFEYFPRQNGPFATSLGLASVETKGRYTVRLNLRVANPIVPMMLSGNTNWGFVSGPSSLARPASLGTTTDGAGQYVLDPAKTVAGDTYTLVPNDHYYDQDKIKFGRVVVKVIASPTTMLQAAKSGQVDVALGDPLTVRSAESAGLNIASAQSGSVGIALADRSGKSSRPLADARVRQALNYAIDRDAITTAMMGRYGTPSSEWENGDTHVSENASYYDYDPEKARALLAEAGYPDGFTLDIVDQGYVGNLGDPAFQAMAKYFDDVGVKLRITTTSALPDYLRKALGGDYPAVGLNWGAGIMYLDHSLLFAPGAILNQNGWSDPVLERLQAQAAAAPPEEATEIWKQMSRRVIEQGYMVTAFTYPILLYSNDKVGGVELKNWTDSMFAPIALDWFPAS